MARGKPERPLNELVATIIETRHSMPRISPSWVATEAMTILDPDHVTERRRPMVYLAAHLELRQLARQQLAKRFNPEDHEGKEDGLFPDLQWRYPTARSAEAEEPEYILRDLMSDEDVEYNVARLRAEANAKLAHAEKLEAWHRGRR